MFRLPSGRVGNDFVNETARLISNFTAGNPMEHISWKAPLVMISLLLQRPHSKSSTKENSQHLNRRLILWSAGDISALLEEGEALQKRLTQCRKSSTCGDVARIFSKLMLEGKVKSAIRLLCDQKSSGILPINSDTTDALLEKHPVDQPADDTITFKGPLCRINPVIFENITNDAIEKAALATQGSAGPSGGDADHWRRMCLSFKTASNRLCTAIAAMARRLCTEMVDPLCLQSVLANRLIPLDKCPGIRPIGIGEALRRIVCKSVMRVVKLDVQQAAGPLQLCAGHEAGCEAALHAATEMFDANDCEAVLLVDADNAFNRLNRAAAIWNIQFLCPTLSTIIINCYRSPSRLFVLGGLEIASREGTTQGDPLAMAMYAMGIAPLIEELRGITKQLWFADDAQAVGQLQHLRIWWDRLLELGPKYGYFPKASKTKLVVKDDKLHVAVEHFAGTGIATSVGARDLGAFIGGQRAASDFIDLKVTSWCEEIKSLADIAKIEPQAAHAAFVHGFRHRWTFVQRTMSNVTLCMGPLEDTIRTVYIPALLGRPVNDVERDMLSLKAAHGGACIDNPTKTTQLKFNSSKVITASLAQKITQQSADIPDAEETRRCKNSVTKTNASLMRQSADEVLESLGEDQARAMKMAQMKGASAIITTKPIKMYGLSLSKTEYRDSMLLRYGWPIPDLPSKCACGQVFSVDHSQMCKVGGFIHMRHDGVRDLLAAEMKKVFNDVETEPPLAPLTGEILYPRSANTDEQARADIRARGFWNRQQCAYFDVRVFYPNAQSYRHRNDLFQTFEKEKKRKYNDRIIQVERGSFTPLVFSTCGGMGPETSLAIRKLVAIISDKTQEPYSQIMGLLRCRLAFTLIRAAITCLRGTRRPPTTAPAEDDHTRVIIRQAAVII